MNIVDVYTKKEYKCKVCQKPIHYGKIAKENGELYTTDGHQPNGKFGKESNVLTGAVDALVKDRLHACSKDSALKQIDALNEGKTSQTQLSTSNATPTIKWPAGSEPREELEKTKQVVIESLRYGEQITGELYPEMDTNSTLFAQIRNTMSDKILQAYCTYSILQEIAKVKEAIENES